MGIIGILSQISYPSQTTAKYFRTVYLYCGNKYLKCYLIMMIASNSHVRQKQGAQGEEEEDAGGRRKVGPTRTPDPVQDNVLQTHPSKRANHRIFLAYVSDDFKTKKKYVRIFFLNMLY